MSSLEDSYELLHFVIKFSEILDTDWKQVALELSIKNGKRLSEDTVRKRWSRWGIEHVKNGGGMPPVKGDRKIAPRKSKPKAGEDRKDEDGDEAGEVRFATGQWPKAKGKGTAKNKGEKKAPASKGPVEKEAIDDDEDDEDDKDDEDQEDLEDQEQGTDFSEEEEEGENEDGQ